MTEYEKKQNGEIYDARDIELRKQQNRAKDLMREYNAIPAADNEERKRVLNLLIGHFGENSRVNQPFYVDYGSNYDECLDRAADEKANNARPQLAEHIDDMEKYDIRIRYKSIADPLGSEPIGRLIFKYSLTAIISSPVGLSYNIVDQIFIGNSVGELVNAATNVAFTLRANILHFA